MGASPGTMGARSRPPGTTDRPDSRQKAPLQRIAPNTRKITQFGSDFISLQKYFASSPRNLAGARSVKVPFGELTLSIWAFPNSSTQSSFPVVRNTPAKERDLNDLKPGLVGKEKRVLDNRQWTAVKRASMGIKAIVVFLVGLVLASGCVASSGVRYRPCHELRTDMSVSNDEFYRRCPPPPSD
jgi:hypothetical protein